VASLVRPFGLLAIAGRNGRKAEALGRSRPFTVHTFFYFQKSIFVQNSQKICIHFQNLIDQGSYHYTYQDHIRVSAIFKVFLDWRDIIKDLSKDF
jgi:hypothetical protein